MFIDETALWTIAAAGCVEGCVVRERGRWRLSWFEGADRRLASYAGPVDDDLEGLARLGIERPPLVCGNGETAGLPQQGAERAQFLAQANIAFHLMLQGIHGHGQPQAPHNEECG